MARAQKERDALGMTHSPWGGQKEGGHLLVCSNSRLTVPVSGSPKALCQKYETTMGLPLTSGGLQSGGTSHR